MSRLPWWALAVLVVLAGVIAIVTGVLTLVSSDERAPAYSQGTRAASPGDGKIELDRYVVGKP